MRVEVAQARQCRSGWSQGELTQRQLGLQTLTAFILVSAQNMSR